MISPCAALVCVLTLGPNPVRAQLRTIATDHFRIHFLPGSKGTARRVAEVAEEVFAPMAAAYHYYDRFAPVNVVVLDNSDVLGNGFADDYTNTIVIWSTNTFGELRGTQDWVKSVLTHELTHIMTINMASKRWPFEFALLSVSRFDQNPDISFNFPIYYQNLPRWWAEGIAQYSTDQFGYDHWDTHRDMYMRMAALEDDMLTYDEMGSARNRTGSYYGEYVYNHGYSLLLYIQEKYGRDKVEALTQHVGSMSFDPAIRHELGISAEQLYSDWKRYLQERYGRMAAELQSQGLFEGRELKGLNQGIVEYFPEYSPDGRKLAYVTSRKYEFPITRLAIHDFDTGQTKVLKGFVDARTSWSPDSKELVFVRNKGGFDDLYIYNLEADKERRITANLRAKDPHFSPDGKRIAFVHNADGTTNLGIIQRDGSGKVYLTNNNDGTQYGAPHFSPDGEYLLFSIFRGEDNDIAMIRADSPPRPKNYGLRKRKKQVPDSLKVFPDSLAFPSPDTSGFRVVLASRADERDPCWLPEGDGFVFSSDRTGVFNIYKYDLESGRVEQLTNVLGGAFTPTVAPGGKVAYVGYHASDFSLYEFPLESAFRRETSFEPVLGRDYQSIFRGPKVSKEFTMTRYGGRRIFRFTPILEIGPTNVGNSFGLDEVSGGFQVSAGEFFGGEQLTAWGIVGKNFRDATDFNTDFGVSYQRRLFPLTGNNHTFNPSFFGVYRRREIDNLIRTRTTVQDTTLPVATVPVPADSANSNDFILLPNTAQRIIQLDSRRDLFKSKFQTINLGFDLPITRRQRATFQYTFRNYDQNWSLRRFRQELNVFLIQDGVLDVTENLLENLARQDTFQVTGRNPTNFFDDLDFYTAHELTLSWSYTTVQPTADAAINPTGRAITLLYRYILPSFADSLAQQTSPDGVPRDQLGPAKKRGRINEYLGSYVERVGLPANNAISIQILGAFRNARLKDSRRLDGNTSGLFEGNFNWPLRYYLGGLNFLSGYPFFTDWGSKLVYGRIGYSFPLSRRVNMGFFNFTFSKLYAELFAETGAVGNFGNLNDLSFRKKSFLSDVGAEVRMQLFTFYRIPMRAFFQVAHPLNRDSLRSREREEARLRQGLSPGAPLPPGLDPGKVANWRFYFGLGF